MGDVTSMEQRYPAETRQIVERLRAATKPGRGAVDAIGDGKRLFPYERWTDAHGDEWLEIDCTTTETWGPPKSVWDEPSMLTVRLN